jgi:hypothetical protein
MREPVIISFYDKNMVLLKTIRAFDNSRKMFDLPKDTEHIYVNLDENFEYDEDAIPICFLFWYYSGDVGPFITRLCSSNGEKRYIPCPIDPSEMELGAKFCVYYYGMSDNDSYSSGETSEEEEEEEVEYF